MEATVIKDEAIDAYCDHFREHGDVRIFEPFLFSFANEITLRFEGGDRKTSRRTYARAVWRRDWYMKRTYTLYWMNEHNDQKLKDSIRVFLKDCQWEKAALHHLVRQDEDDEQARDKLIHVERIIWCARFSNFNEAYRRAISEEVTAEGLFDQKYIIDDAAALQAEQQTDPQTTYWQQQIQTTDPKDERATFLRLKSIPDLQAALLDPTSLDLQGYLARLCTQLGHDHDFVQGFLLPGIDEFARHALPKIYQQHALDTPAAAGTAWRLTDDMRWLEHVTDGFEKEVAPLRNAHFALMRDLFGGAARWNKAQRRVELPFVETAEQAAEQRFWTTLQETTKEVTREGEESLPVDPALLPQTSTLVNPE